MISLPNLGSSFQVIETKGITWYLLSDIAEDCRSRQPQARIPDINRLESNGFTGSSATSVNACSTGGRSGGHAQAARESGALVGSSPNHRLQNFSLVPYRVLPHIFARLGGAYGEVLWPNSHLSGVGRSTRIGPLASGRLSSSLDCGSACRSRTSLPVRDRQLHHVRSASEQTLARDHGQEKSEARPALFPILPCPAPSSSPEKAATVRAATSGTAQPCPPRLRPAAGVFSDSCFTRRIQ